MKFSSHVSAAVITVLAVVIFLILRSAMDFQFGLRTYWPVFLTIYLVVWYIGGLMTNKSGDRVPEND